MYSISGKIVSDVYGLPISNAAFFMQMIDGSKKFIGKSNAFGVFTISPVSGPGRIVICAPGFVPAYLDPDVLEDSTNLIINNFGEKVGSAAIVLPWLKLAMTAGIAFVGLKLLASNY